MKESKRWGLSRYVTLLAVLTLHAALLALLVAESRNSSSASPLAPPIQLIYLSRIRAPKIHFDDPRLRHASAGTRVPISPPKYEISASPAESSQTTFGSDGDGSRVDWAAEARRALQAFDIRSRHPASNESVSRTSPAEQSWWPRHRAGERFKMANGDWIVWVNSSCYQVATSAPPAAGAAIPPGTVCPEKPEGGH